MVFYSFCENNFMNTEKMNDFRIKGKFVDFNVVVHGTSFAAHKIVLWSNIPYFDSKAINEKSIEINEKMVKAEDFRLILDFCYTGKITFSSTNALSLLGCASFFKLNQIKFWCYKVLREIINVNNVFDILKMAEKIDFNELVYFSKKFIIENFTDFSENNNFVNLNENQLKEIISDDYLKMYPEETVYETLIKWIKHDEENRKVFLPSLLKCVRLTLIPRNYFLAKVCIQKLIRTSDDCQELIERIKNFLLFPEEKSLVEDLCTQQRLSFVDEFIFSINQNNGNIKIYNIEENKWKKFETKNSITFEKCFYSIVFENKIYAIGGEKSNKLKIFDVSTKTWTEGKQMKEKKWKFGISLLDNKIYVFGGGNTETLLKDVECYDTKEKKWETLPEMSSKRAGVSAISLNTDIFLIGGFDDELKYLNIVEKFDTLSKQWSKMKEMNTKRGFHGVEKLKGKIYAVGGRNEDDNNFLDSVEVYDPIKNEWTFVASMKEKRAGFGLVSYRNKLYAFGGLSNKFMTSASKTGEVYDPETNQWTLLPFDYVLGGNDCGLLRLNE